MRAVQKLELIDQIGRELQSRFRYEEIDHFLGEFGVSPPPSGAVSTNSKWVYAKAALRNAPEETIINIAQELDLDTQLPSGRALIPPRNWQGTTQFRMFISHISKDRDKATRLKECLSPYAIGGFVAHEDIHPTLEWQGEIERALYAMDAFIAIHTKGFSQSVWTQQEIGFALGRGIKIISFKMGEDPTGFISKHQALARRGRSAEDIAREVADLLSHDDRTSSRLLQAQRATNLAPADDEIPF